MENIKSFKFESEGVILNLNINKQLHGSGVRLIINGEINSNNPDLKRFESFNGSSKNIFLKYQNTTVLWVSSNDWKGFRWEKYANETRYSIYTNLQEMKECYIRQREFITVISNYFYDSIKKYKQIKLLYETPLEDLISEE